ncbi:phosphotransferase family protein [Thalassobacillus pellis]|uniref:phosphotransferase family protein n=1 Tax=Thalassobacillus pellis TaxID=748008 RepID=UPI0019605A88|nr:phosphotransferase family protein [Thalassobacillus pellis]
MEHILGDEWTITPAGGSTGEAYYAQNDNKRLFLKRNSSPFLAVLSAEGIVPKLVWTKRLENGDVITAQEWLEGRELKTEEMQHPRVAKLLSKIHHSSELLDMLMRISKHPLLPKDILEDIKVNEGLFEKIDPWSGTRDAISYLEARLPEVETDRHVVCHCDMNHNNWMLSLDDQLYLIDWDNAMVADPAMDLGMLLHWYIPRSEWKAWLDRYGMEETEGLYKRMTWYAVAQSLTFIQWHRMRGDLKEAAQRVESLKQLMITHGITNL